MMKTPEQLKGAIRNLAKKKGIHAQEVLQIFMFERIIERLSVSPYKDRFILKGGLLISAILGVAERTTMDMDTTVKGLPMDEQSIRKAISEILDQPVDDGIEFQLLDLTPIREDDEYENFRASIQATYGKMKIPMKIDITTGDEITPKEIQFSYPFLFDDRRVMVKAYTQETILAEKYETIIRRNVGNTRARDSLSVLQDTKRILLALKESTVLQDLWKRYQAQNLYAGEITYPAIMETVKEFTEKMNFYR